MTPPTKNGHAPRDLLNQERAINLSILALSQHGKQTVRPRDNIFLYWTPLRVNINLTKVSSPWVGHFARPAAENSQLWVKKKKGCGFSRSLKKNQQVEVCRHRREWESREESSRLSLPSLRSPWQRRKNIRRDGTTTSLLHGH